MIENPANQKKAKLMLLTAMILFGTLGLLYRRNPFLRNRPHTGRRGLSLFTRVHTGKKDFSFKNGPQSKSETADRVRGFFRVQLDFSF